MLIAVLERQFSAGFGTRPADRFFSTLWGTSVSVPPIAWDFEMQTFPRGGTKWKQRKVTGDGNRGELKE